MVWRCRAVVHITAAHFLSNRGGRGGAVAGLDGAAARVTDCKFHRNSADRFGGGVFVAEDAQATRIVRAPPPLRQALLPVRLLVLALLLVVLLLVVVVLLLLVVVVVLLLVKLQPLLL